MTTPATARAYRVHAGNPTEDCILAFACTAREAKRAAWHILHDRGAEWLDMRAEWIRGGADVHRLPGCEQEGEAYAVQPMGCIQCECWSYSQVIQFPDLCDSCAEELAWENGNAGEE